MPSVGYFIAVTAFVVAELALIGVSRNVERDGFFQIAAITACVGAIVLTASSWQ